MEILQMPELTHVPCPLCGKDDPKVLLKTDQPFMRIVACGACGMMYQSPQVPESELGDAHLHFEEYTHYPSLNGAKVSLFKTRVAEMARRDNLGPSGAFLDVGTGYGAMLDAVADCLPGWSRMALEISGSAREQLKARGHDSVSLLEDLPVDAKFDWINLDNVLEHMPNPRGMLESLRSRLNPGGFLYVEVPNEAFIRLRYRVNDWARGFSKPPTFPGHMSLFTRQTLREMSQAAGFDRIRIWGESISSPWRIQALSGMSPTGKLHLILGFLRWTRLDLATGQGYFLCARLGLRDR